MLRAARMLATGDLLGECAAAMVAHSSGKGHAGARRDPIDLLDDGDGDRTDPGDKPTDLACELIRLVRALVWASILAQLATLALVGGLSGVSLLVQLGAIQISGGP